LAVTDWRLRRWRLWFLALMTATLQILHLHIVYRIYVFESRRAITLKAGGKQQAQTKQQPSYCQRKR